MRVSFFVVVVLAGCIKSTQVNIGTKTSLERQLIGELEPLNDEELLAASVRAEATGGLGPLEDARARAIAARRRQLFNRDDVDELKTAGCLGESKEATLAVRECTNPELASRASRIVTEENADRGAVIDWAVATDSALTQADRHEVVAVYRRLLAEQARPGEWIQNDDGGWSRR